MLNMVFDEMGFLMKMSTWMNFFFDETVLLDESGFDEHVF